MKLLLDENLPRKLVAALRAEGHEVESVHTLQLQGLENGRLYEFACETLICASLAMLVSPTIFAKNLFGEIEIIASNSAAKGRE